MTIYEALDHPWLNVSTTVYYYVVSTSTIQLVIQSPQNHRTTELMLQILHGICYTENVYIYRHTDVCFNAIG